MSKRKSKAPRRACDNCGSTDKPVSARYRGGGKCRVCPECRALYTQWIGERFLKK